MLFYIFKWLCEPWRVGYEKLSKEPFWSRLIALCMLKDSNNYVKDSNPLHSLKVLPLKDSNPLCKGLRSLCHILSQKLCLLKWIQILLSRIQIFFVFLAHSLLFQMRDSNLFILFHFLFEFSFLMWIQIHWYCLQFLYIFT